MKKLFGLLSVVLVAVICFTQPVDAAKKEKRAKYVFYFIGDGMGQRCIWLREQEKSVSSL